MKRRDLERYLRSHGARLLREGARHSFWGMDSERSTAVPRHREIGTGLVRYDRNLMGIDPRGVVHISDRLLREEDGPMLGNGLQHFHGAQILSPRRADDRPDRDRLAARFAEFEGLAA